MFYLLNFVIRFSRHRVAGCDVQVWRVPHWAGGARWQDHQPAGAGQAHAGQTEEVGESRKNIFRCDSTSKSGYIRELRKLHLVSTACITIFTSQFIHLFNPLALQHNQLPAVASTDLSVSCNKLVCPDVWYPRSRVTSEAWQCAVCGAPARASSSAWDVTGWSWAGSIPGSTLPVLRHLGKGPFDYHLFLNPPPTHYINGLVQ